MTHTKDNRRCKDMLVLRQEMQLPLGQILFLCVLLSCSTVDSFTPLQKHVALNPTETKTGTLSFPFLGRGRSRGSTTNIHSSWSQRDSHSDGSRFGVRRRVRAALEKAKNRTGIKNINSEIDSNSFFDFPVEDPFSSLYQFKVSESISQKQSAPIVYNQIVQAASAPTEQTTFPKTVSTSAVNEKLILEQSYAQAINIEPLPFSLPKLNSEQRQTLAKGERVQQQSTMSREGSGYVVMDIPAPAYVIWEALLDFEAYPQNIGTVRSMQMFTNTNLRQSYVAEKPVLPGTGRETRHYGNGSITRASFVLSKFQLNIAAIHKYVPHPDGHYMEFTLDKACTNAVLKDAKGIWHTESIKDEQTGQDLTRVWLLCELKVSSLLPQFIVDYAARKAMPRATNWLMPTVERLRKEFKIDDTSYLA